MLTGDELKRVIGRAAAAALRGDEEYHPEPLPPYEPPLRVEAAARIGRTLAHAATVLATDLDVLELQRGESRRDALLWAAWELSADVATRDLALGPAVALLLALAEVAGLAEDEAMLREQLDASVEIRLRKDEDDDDEEQRGEVSP
jgi:hypothetical protein